MLICVCVYVLDKLNVSIRSAKLPVLSSNDIRQLKPVTRTSNSLVNQQPVKRMTRSLAIDSVSSETQLSTETSNKVK